VPVICVFPCIARRSHFLVNLFLLFRSSKSIRSPQALKNPPTGERNTGSWESNVLEKVQTQKFG
jgi:hypothetical protein